MIYMVGTSSEADPGEKIVKEPIAVKPADLDQKLHPKSRINFDKVHSVEHNVKVMHVGKVADKSLHNLSLYYQLAHFPPPEARRSTLSVASRSSAPTSQTLPHLLYVTETGQPLRRGQS